MTREEAIEIMQINRDGVANMSRSEDRTKTLAAFDMAIKALEQEPCEDAISRLAALEKIHWLGLDNDTAIKCDLAIRALPPVNPQEPKFIAKSDGTIEQIKNCDDCLYKREWEKIGKLIKVVLEKQTEPQESEGAK